MTDTSKKRTGGRPRKTEEEKFVKASVYLPAELIEAVDREAKECGLSRNAIIIQALMAKYKS